MGVIHHRQRLPFGLETLDYAAGVHPEFQDLKRDRPPHRVLLLCPVDRAPSPFSDQFHKPVGPNLITGTLSRKLSPVLPACSARLVCHCRPLKKISRPGRRFKEGFHFRLQIRIPVTFSLQQPCTRPLICTRKRRGKNLPGTLGCLNPFCAITAHGRGRLSLLLRKCFTASRKLREQDSMATPLMRDFVGPPANIVPRSHFPASRSSLSAGSLTVLFTYRKLSMAWTM